MNREEAAKAMAEGKIQIMQPNDKFQFGCKVCGDCCRNRDDILLSPYDMYNMSKALNMSCQDILDKYCNVYLGSGSKMPIVQVKFKEPLGYTVCPFLKKKDGCFKCDVHDRKPFVCAAFPLGRMSSFNTKTGEMESGMYFNGACNYHEKQEHTLQEWIDKFNLTPGIKAGELFHKFMMDISQKYDLKAFYDSEDGITEKTKNMVYSAMVSLLYLGLEKENDDTILDTLKDRFANLSTALEQVMTFGEQCGFKVRRAK
jgi:hypothetical protein